VGNTSNRRPWSTAVRYSAFCLAAIVVALIAAALVVPEFLDRPAVEAQIQRKLSEAVNGEVAWDDLRVRLLPTPRAALRGVRVDVPGALRARIEEADAGLRLLPLFRGRAEITSLSVVRPDIRIEIAAFESADQQETESDLVAGYRFAMGPVVDAVRKFAPDTSLEVDDAIVDVHAPDMLPIRLSGLALQARSGLRGIDLELSTASNYWSRLELSGRVEFSDLSARASVDAADIRPQPWLDRYLPKSPVGVTVPAASVRADLRTDGKTSLDCEFDAHAASVEILRSKGRIEIQGVALKGNAAAGSREIRIHLSDAQFGASKLSRGELRYSLRDDEVSGEAGFDLDLVQAIGAVRRMLPEGNEATLDAVQAVAGTARGNSRFAVGREDWSAGVDILESDASVQVRGLPGPANLGRASVTITRNAVSVDRAALSMLDAAAIASASITYGKQLKVNGAISEGKVGEEFLAWIWQTAHVPPQLELKAPIRIAAPQIAWSPKRAAKVNATASFDAGPVISVDLDWRPGTLDVRRATLKDGRSDAAIGLRMKGRALEGRFSGSLYSTSIESLLKGAKVPSGSATGDLRFVFDREDPRRGSAQGNLKGTDIDLTWLLRRPVKIDRVDVTADGERLRISEASVIWAGQRAALHGEVRRGAGGPVVDAQIDSPGIVLDALLPPRDDSAGKVPLAAKGPPPREWNSLLWPLPVTGRIAMHSGFVKYGSRDITPLAATLALEERRARIDLTQAQLCGISFPLTLEATPGNMSVTARLHAQKQQLEKAVRCLSNESVQITGDFDLDADLSTHGDSEELARNLKGTVTAEVRDGRIRKFVLLGNILSMTDIATLLKEGGPKLDEAGFPYRTISLKGRFQAGRFIVDESGLRSDALGLAATGWISITDLQSRLSVLVAPLGRLDQIVRKVPILGYVIGGTLTSVPVGVSGDIRNPLVLPLGPEAITSELKGIFTRTLKLPENILAPLRAKPAGDPSPGQ
jgi:hypothetical protein